MARRLVGVTLERRLVTVPVAGEPGCITDMELCCEGSGSGSGSGGGECTQACPQCMSGMSAVWELVATGYDPVLLYHDETPDDGNYCRFNSLDLSWSLYFDRQDELWLLVNYDTEDVWYLPEGGWDCDGENLLLAVEEGVDSALVTPVYACTEVSYNCVDESCVAVSGTGGTYATLAECQAACGGGTIPTACCPSDLLPEELTAVVSGAGAANGTYTLAWRSGAFWSFRDVLGTCNGLGTADVLALSCAVSTPWQLAVGLAGPYTPFVAECSPLRLIFSGVDFTACGGTTGGVVEVT